MAMRLSELLERIRPAGAPGAADGGASERERAATAELAPLSAQLTELDAEADELIESARREATAIRADGERRATAIRDALAEQVAVAGASTDQCDVPGAEAELRRLRDDAARERSRRERLAAEHRDRLADRAIDDIWSLVAAGERAVR